MILLDTFCIQFGKNNGVLCCILQPIKVYGYNYWVHRAFIRSSLDAFIAGITPANVLRLTEIIHTLIIPSGR